MSRFYGWLTGTSPKAVTRTGTKNSGIRTKLKSLTGLSVSTRLFEQADGQEVVHIHIEIRGTQLLTGDWIADDDGELRKIR